jgi:hypothetical protein
VRDRREGTDSKVPVAGRRGASLRYFTKWILPGWRRWRGTLAAIGVRGQTESQGTERTRRPWQLRWCKSQWCDKLRLGTGGETKVSPQGRSDIDPHNLKSSGV